MNYWQLACIILITVVISATTAFFIKKNTSVFPDKEPIIPEIQVDKTINPETIDNNKLYLFTSSKKEPIIFLNGREPQVDENVQPFRFELIGYNNPGIYDPSGILEAECYYIYDPIEDKRLKFGGKFIWENEDSPSYNTNVILVRLGRNYNFLCFEHETRWFTVPEKSFDLSGTFREEYVEELKFWSTVQSGWLIKEVDSV